MKNRHSSKQISVVQSDHLPNPIMIARQIDGLREVMQRMRTAQSNTLDHLINQKLEQATQC